MPQFTFSFACDDIEEDQNEEDQEMVDEQEVIEHGEPNVDLVPARVLELQEMLSTLPSSLAYSTHTIKTPATTVSIPRRTLFDIRAQIMAEDDLEPDQSPSTIGLSADDILPKTYEGGFKTWECSVELAEYLLRLMEEKKLSLEGKDVSIIEASCGTSLPTSLLLSHILSLPIQPHQNHAPDPPKTTIILADYNSQVLTHASLPNLLLTYASRYPDLQPFPAEETLSTLPSLLTAFTTALSARNIHVTGLSGAWSSSFVQLANSITCYPSTTDESSPRAGAIPRHPHLKIITASETLYSPSSLPAFISTLRELLQPPPSDPHPHPSSEFHTTLALLATKKIYFGVGGGIDQFLERWRDDCGGWARVVWDSDRDRNADGGVGRCIVEVGIGKN